MTEDREELLNLLNSYGQQFMSSFDSSIFGSKRTDTPEAGPSSSRKKRKVEEVPEPEEDSEEEWQGFGGSESEDESDVEEDEDVSEGTRAGQVPACYIHSDIPDETQDAQKGKKSAVVVFSETTAKSFSAPSVESRAQLKAFMVGASYSIC